MNRILNVYLYLVLKDIHFLLFDFRRYNLNLSYLSNFWATAMSIVCPHISQKSNVDLVVLGFLKIVVSICSDLDVLVSKYWGNNCFNKFALIWT